jgi:hypothetical protein
VLIVSLDFMASIVKYVFFPYSFYFLIFLSMIIFLYMSSHVLRGMCATKKERQILTWYAQQGIFLHFKTLQ